jgi:hypothetical protein
VAETRIKGQEVEIVIVSGSTPLETITDIKSFEMTAQLEILREGYLGETTDRRDEIYKGVKGRMELNFENDDIIALMRQVVDRARRREPGLKINIKATLVFGNGDRPRINIPNAFFGEIPMNFGSRSDYGSITLDFEAEDFSVVST